MNTVMIRRLKKEVLQQLLQKERMVVKVAIKDKEKADYLGELLSTIRVMQEEKNKNKKQRRSDPASSSSRYDDDFHDDDHENASNDGNGNDHGTQLSIVDSCHERTFSTVEIDKYIHRCLQTQNE